MNLNTLCNSANGTFVTLDDCLPDTESVCSLLRESSDLKGRINLPITPMSLAFLYARGARHGSVEGPDMWNQVLDNALREPAGRWGIGWNRLHARQVLL